MSSHIAFCFVSYRNVIVSWGSFTDIGRLTQNDISTEIQMALNADITDSYSNVIDLNLLVSEFRVLTLEYSIYRVFKTFYAMIVFCFCH